MVSAAAEARMILGRPIQEAGSTRGSIMPITGSQEEPPHKVMADRGI
jgi:hypothetical protein